MTRPTPIPPAIAELARLTGYELRCVECPRTSPPADPGGWRGFLTSDEPPETATYCPDCAAREFGTETSA